MDFASEVEWYNSTTDLVWKLQFSTFKIDSTSLMEPEPTEANANVTEYPVYAHFNSSYPFLGVDTYIGDKIEAKI